MSSAAVYLLPFRAKRSHIRTFGCARARRTGHIQSMNEHLTLTVNGHVHEIDAAGTTPLLDVLRNHLGLKGSRYGCGLEQCGACMVLADGETVYSCSREAGTLEGRSILTVEGLAADGALHPLQQAFLDEQAGQCGYCLSGIIIEAKALLDRMPTPSRGEIVAALDRHICRCGAHQRIVRAIERAAKAMSKP